MMNLRRSQASAAALVSNRQTKRFKGLLKTDTQDRFCR